MSGPTLARAAAAAALVLAATSRGELAVLAVALVLADRIEPTAPLRVLAVAGALGASAWRWGTTSLEALAGAQAVLGPAGGVGPAPAAVGSWLGGAALVLALARGRDPVRHVAVGAAVAAVLAGPGPGGPLPVRIAVGVGVAAGAAALAAVRADRARLDRVLLALGAMAGLGAVAAVWAGDPASSPRLPGDLVVEGLAIAVAAAALVAVVTQAAPRWRRRGAAPSVERRPPGLRPARQAALPPGP